MTSLQGLEMKEPWVYDMRRDMQEIIPGLFLGPYSSAMKSQLVSLQKHGITHIVCIRQPIEYTFVKVNFPDHFRYLDLNIADSPLENIIRFFPTVKQFLDECLASGGRALVHGNAGISRSATLVIAYVMEKMKLSYIDALSYVQCRRFCVGPNEGFTRQLMEYEPMYKAREIVENSALMGAVNVNSIAKRKFEEDEDDISKMENFI